MPAVNPFIDQGVNVEATDGSPVNFIAGLPIIGQAVRPASAQVGARGNTQFNQRFAGMNPNAQASSSQNAAGTSENIALHVAVIVALAMVGVYVLRSSGFKFVVAGSVG